MKRVFDHLKGRVVVITGASSGIGRAAAHAFARCGARVVLAARRQEVLRDAAGECQRLGAHALVVPTDVTDPVAMQALVDATLDAYGRIDVWINNAGVGLFGPYTDAPIDANRRVVETNLFGTMNAAACVLPVFRRQHRGVMITNISVGGFVPAPFAAAYTASKFALRGFMASLRGEWEEHDQIQLCSLFPSMVDTPGFQHGANVSGHQLQAPRAPLLRPEKVANVMVDMALHPRAEVSVGWPTRPAKAGYALSPRLTKRIGAAFLRRVARHGDHAPPTTGNLFVPVEAGTGASGGRKPAASTQRALALAGVATLGAAWYWSRRRQTRTDVSR